MARNTWQTPELELEVVGIGSGAPLPLTRVVQASSIGFFEGYRFQAPFSSNVATGTYLLGAVGEVTFSADGGNAAPVEVYYGETWDPVLLGEVPPGQTRVFSFEKTWVGEHPLHSSSTVFEAHFAAGASQATATLEAATVTLTLSDEPPPPPEPDGPATWVPLADAGVDFDFYTQAPDSVRLEGSVVVCDGPGAPVEFALYFDPPRRVRLTVLSYTSTAGDDGSYEYPAYYYFYNWDPFVNLSFENTAHPVPVEGDPHEVRTGFIPAQNESLVPVEEVFFGPAYGYDALQDRYEILIEIDVPGGGEVTCFWTDLVGVSQVCGSAPEPEPEPELPVVFAYNQHQGAPEGQTSRILLPPGVVQFTPVWVNGLYEFQDAEGGGGMLQTVDYADAYGLVGPATLSNEQSPGEDWYEAVDVIIEYRSGVGYAQAGGWHGDGFMILEMATTGAPDYDTLYPIDTNSDLGPVQLQIADRVWTFEWESGRYATQDPPPADDISGWGTITQNGVVAPMLITFFALWE